MSIFGQARLSKRLLIHTLELERGCVDNRRVACVLREPAFANQRLNLFEGGIPHAAKEASDICEGLGDPVGPAECLNYLAWLPQEDRQLEAGEEAANILPANFVAILPQYILQNARGGRRFAISRHPLESHSLSTDTISYSGIITPWRSYFWVKTGLTMRRPPPSEPNHIQLEPLTSWVVR